MGCTAGFMYNAIINVNVGTLLEYMTQLKHMDNKTYECILFYSVPLQDCSRLPCLALPDRAVPVSETT